MYNVISISLIVVIGVIGIAILEYEKRSKK